jgi:hypothetical protein
MASSSEEQQQQSSTEREVLYEEAEREFKKIKKE